MEAVASLGVDEDLLRIAIGSTTSLEIISEETYTKRYCYTIEDDLVERIN